MQATVTISPEAAETLIPPDLKELLEKVSGQLRDQQTGVRILSAAQLADKLGVSYQAALKLLKDHVLKPPIQFMIAGKYKVNEALLDEWLRDAGNVLTLARY